MASTTVVVDLEDGAALSPDRLVARLISAVPEAKETALAAQAEKSWPRLVAAILAHTDAILAADDADEGDAVFLHLFAAICRFTDDDDFKTAAVSTTDALAGAASAPAARRMRLIVRLYNTLSNRCGAKLHSLLNLLKLARESKQLGRLAVFLRDIEGLPARWSLSPEDSRMLLLEAALATDAAQNADLAQSLRTAYLRTFQGCEAAVLVEAEPVAIKAATAYIRTPVVSQRSDLTSLDAVKALAGSSTPGAASLCRLLVIFGEGSVADLAAFQASDADTLARVGVSAEDAMAVMRILTLASAAAGTSSLALEDVAKAVDVAPEDAERWVVMAIERGLIEGRIDQAAGRVLIVRATPRSFQEADWRGLSTRLGAWRGEVEHLVAAIKGGSAGRGARAAAAAGSA